MKRTIISIMMIMFIIINAVTTNAVATPDTITDTGANDTSYSVISAISSKTYDFASDFCDSFPYDEDFETEGIFDMRDHEPDVTLTLKNNTTDETFTYQPTEETIWYIDKTIDYLLHETTTLEATLVIETLGNDYNINDVQIPIEIEVYSSEYEANVHRYSNYESIYNGMEEGENFYVVPVSDTKLKIVITNIRHWMSVDFYNTETKQREHFEYSDGSIEVLETEIEIDKPKDRSFWFALPCRVKINEDYAPEIYIGINGRLKEKPTDTETTATESIKETVNKTTDTSATPDNINQNVSKTNSNAVTTNGNAVATGETNIAIIMLIILMMISFGAVIFIKKHNAE